MPLPTIETIKNTIEKEYSTAIHDPKLAGYRPLPGLLGPLFYPGGFGVVFPMVNASNHKYAFRVWHKEIPGIKERTGKISAFLKTQHLPYFVEFDYVTGGLTVRDDQGPRTVDTVRMDWVEGENLHEFISSAKEDCTVQEFKSRMRTLAGNFKKMFQDLHQCGISHGDLQHGNVVILPDLSIKLVDYDSVYVPSIAGEKQITVGLSGYQHPSRKSRCDEAAVYDDYFSELIIYSGLLVLSVNPDFWPDNEEEIDNFSFLLTEKDFEDIARETKGNRNPSPADLRRVRSSALFAKMLNISSSLPEDQSVIKEIQDLLALLVNYLNTNDLSTLNPIPGTKKSSRKSIYNPPEDESVVDAESLKGLLKDITPKSSRHSYLGGSQQGSVAIIEKTDPEERKDKYRNQ